MTRIFQMLIRVYSVLVSPLFGRSCRYHPTCSAYAHDALEKHGLCKGIALSVRRILRCHPWSKHNYYDPVPKRFAWGDILGYKRSTFSKKDDTAHRCAHENHTD